MSHQYPPVPDQQAPQDPPHSGGQWSQPQVPPQGPPPYGPPPGGYAPQGGPYQPGAPKGSGLAISALVVGAVALLLCWVPIVNNVAALLAVVGLALGIPAWVSARRGTRSGSGLAVAGVIVSALALAGVLATQAFYVSVLDDVADELDAVEFTPGDAEAPAEVDPDAGSDPAEAAPTAPAVLPPGQAGQLSEYTVTVDSVTLNGNDVVAAENPYNDPPTGQYVLVALTVTYNGPDEGDPWLDLSTEFIGTDARKYDTSSCSALIPNEASDVPTLLAGGTASYQVCMDVPPTAVEGGQVEVSESFSWDDASVTWATQ